LFKCSTFIRNSVINKWKSNMKKYITCRWIFRGFQRNSILFCFLLRTTI
jgi:hypothetical protein